MRKICLFLLIIGVLMSSFVRTAEAKFKLERDKMLHIAVSALIYDVAYLYCEERGLDKSHSFWYATLVTAAAGILKEEIDDVFDYDDLLADGIGWALGVAMIELEF